jgi:hypothetical protein
MNPDIPIFSPTAWEPRLRELAGRLRQAARTEMERELAAGTVQRPVAEGLGDVTYALDAATEEALEQWFRGVARTEPISLFSEDAGWRRLRAARL